MEREIRIESAAAVKALIARKLLSAASHVSTSRLGSVELQPHQVSAVERLLPAIDEFGGALLADDVGMGKTFVSLAVARQFRKPMVIAPAALRDMWMQQSARAGLDLPFQSFELLSRKRTVTSECDLVILDEAHHIRNPATVRYRALCGILLHSRVLMLSATPVHNSRKDLHSLLALFMGSRAETLSESELTRCVIRRKLDATTRLSGMPEVGAVRWNEIDDDNDIPKLLLALPPPVPASDGGLAAALIARGLLRQWCSSDTALQSAIRRRLARAMALVESLEAGRYPTKRELDTWSFAEDSLQLAFPALVATVSGNCAALLVGVRQHESALRNILSILCAETTRDTTRAQIIKHIVRFHAGVPIVAFSQYAATVDGLFRELRNQPGVAALTAAGARVAGGALSRREALARFAPLATGAQPPRGIERISLLLTTDLLSEGVNLQDAGVAIHLDLPWTAARMEQRVGRIRRLGSNHATVYTYGIRPARSAELLIGLERTIRRKTREANLSTDPLALDERIRAILSSWITDEAVSTSPSHAVAVAGISARKPGFIALYDAPFHPKLICFDGEHLTDSATAILEWLRGVGPEELVPSADDIDSALRWIDRWLIERNTLNLTRIDATRSSHARRIALKRIGVITHDARPHMRQHILTLADAARRTLLGHLSAAAETRIVELESLDIDDEEWLRAISQCGSPSAVEHSENEVVALLLLLPVRDE
ncbi:MAG TPA: SNF2-related protein [Gemmatimonadaceae bacterium]|nr:SNF2-related protein [Gemmatimonadaceae bacterium]